MITSNAGRVFLVASIMCAIPRSADALPNWVSSAQFVAERQCVSDPSQPNDCNYAVSTSVPTGYATTNVEIFLTNYYIGFTSSPDTLPVKRIKIGVEKTGYDPIAGRLTWNALGYLESNTMATFEFGVTATIIMTDGTSTYVKNAIFTGTGDSAAGVSDTGMVTGVNGTLSASEVEFMGFYIKSFDIVATGNALTPYSQLVDLANYYTTVNAQGKLVGWVDWSCGFGDPASEPEDCTIKTLAVSHIPGRYGATMEWYDRLFNGSGYGDFQDVTLHPEATMWYVGLQKADVHYTTGVNARLLQGVSAGCIKQFGYESYWWTGSISTSPAEPSSFELGCKEVQLK